MPVERNRPSSSPISFVTTRQSLAFLRLTARREIRNQHHSNEEERWKVVRTRTNLVGLIGHVGRRCMHGLHSVLLSSLGLLIALDSIVGEMLGTEILQALCATPPK